MDPPGYNNRNSLSPNVYFTSESFNDSKLPHTPFFTNQTGGRSYPSPPLSGSVLRHTVSLPSLVEEKQTTTDDQHLSALDMPISLPEPVPRLPLSPPLTLPINTFTLPPESEDVESFLPSSVFSEDVEREMDYESSLDIDQIPPPLTPANWLTVGTSIPNDDQDVDLTDDYDRTSPKPLCSEPTRSMWSPESPQHKDELDLEPLASASSSGSSWDSELLSDNVSSSYCCWAVDPLSRLDWAPIRGESQLDVDDFMDSEQFDCLKPILGLEQSYQTYDYPMSPEEDEDLLRSPMILRRSMELDLDEDTELSIPQTPPRRRRLRRLQSSEDPDLDDVLERSPPSPRILSLPGADTDDSLLSFDLPPPTEDDLPYASHGLGLSLASPVDFPSPVTSAGSPSPEHTNSTDLFTEFPELEGYPLPIPIADDQQPLSPSDPDYDLFKLIQLCRRSKQCERHARKEEAAYNERVSAISASLLPPFGEGGAIGRRNRLWELQHATEMRSEARKTRKQEKERWREVRSLVRLKAEAVVRERMQEEATPPVDDAATGKKWMLGDMPQLVAKMLFNRREASRPLAGRKIAGVARDYNRSPLSRRYSAAEAAEEEDIDMDDIMQGMHNFGEAPMIIN